jgi:hypothetical protein
MSFLKKIQAKYEIAAAVKWTKTTTEEEFPDKLWNQDDELYAMLFKKGKGTLTFDREPNGSITIKWPSGSKLLMEPSASGYREFDKWMNS